MATVVRTCHPGRPGAQPRLPPAPDSIRTGYALSPLRPHRGWGRARLRRRSRPSIPASKSIALPTDLYRPFGHAEWSAPYESLAPLVLGSSAIAPLTMGELATIARLDPDSVLAEGLTFDYT